MSNWGSKQFAIEIAEALQSFSKTSIKQYTPLVNEIITQKIEDESHIQKVLDLLLDFCFDEDVLYLYRRLCRYYMDINPKATAEYIEYYKGIYDSKAEKFGTTKGQR